MAAAHRLVWIDSIGIRVLLMLSTHLLPRVIHHEMTLIALTILLVATRIRILPGSVPKWRHDHILNIIVYRQVYRGLLHLRLLLRAGPARNLKSLLAAALVRNWLLIASVLVVRVVRIDVGAVGVAHLAAAVVFALHVLVVVLGMRVDALVGSAWVLVIVACADADVAFLGCLFGVGAILTRSHSRVWTNHLTLHAEKRLINLY